MPQPVGQRSRGGPDHDLDGGFVAKTLGNAYYSAIINHYRAPTPGGTPAVVQILAVSGTFQMGTTASTLLVFTPTSRVDILEGDVIEFETVVAQAAPTGAQMRTWTVEVAQSEGGGS